MKMMIITCVAALFCTSALAQQVPIRPDTPAPTHSAPPEEREQWCQNWVARLVAQQPGDNRGVSFARETQRVENEINYCKLDPVEYERLTLEELELAAR